jgi:hypothetical protein
VIQEGHRDYVRAMSQAICIVCCVCVCFHGSIKGKAGFRSSICDVLSCLFAHLSSIIAFTQSKPVMKNTRKQKPENQFIFGNKVQESCILSYLIFFSFSLYLCESILKRQKNKTQKCVRAREREFLFFLSCCLFESGVV